MSRASRFWLTPCGAMNSSARISPGKMDLSFLANLVIPLASSMIVHDLDILCAAIAPNETDPPLGVDADRMLSLSLPALVGDDHLLLDARGGVGWRCLTLRVRYHSSNQSWPNGV